MGGQESLLALARRPDLFAAVAVADSVTDFYRRWFEFPLSPLTRAEQAKATRELGGTPAQVGWLYQRRSPARFVRTVAFSAVPTADLVEPPRGRRRASGNDPERRVRAAAAPAESGCAGRSGCPFASARRGFPLDDLAPSMVDFLLSHRRGGPPDSGSRTFLATRSAGLGMGLPLGETRSRLLADRARFDARIFQLVGGQAPRDAARDANDPPPAGPAQRHFRLLERALVGAERPRGQAGHDRA